MNYKEILENVLKNGQPKQPVRFDSSNNPIPVENGTIGTFCEIFRHDMSEGFPLSTLRRLPYKSTFIELEGFIKGITSKKWYQERGCNFWNEWANPVKVEEEYKYRTSLGWLTDYSHPKVVESAKKYLQEQENDLGPIYGAQWRNFGKHYGEYIQTEVNSDASCEFEDNANGIFPGFDQLKSIVDKLKTNPYDRRMVCSAWNPNQLHLMALPPCHYSWGVVVYGDKLNLHWNQRSVDTPIGLPANIASYATLLLLLCRESRLQPGELVGKLEDCHIYDNQIEMVKKLVKRKENQLPTLTILPEKGDFSIFDWKFTDVRLDNYNHQGKMNMGQVTV